MQAGQSKGNYSASNWSKAVFHQLQCKQLQQDSLTAIATRQRYGNYSAELGQLQCRARAITVQSRQS